MHLDGIQLFLLSPCQRTVNQFVRPPVSLTVAVSVQGGVTEKLLFVCLFLSVHMHSAATPVRQSGSLCSKVRPLIRR